jgi:ornithine cyclodeaminase/alanine dehydrogenase-like protein (mu-crystallin family)
MRFIDNEIAEQLLTPAECIDSLEVAFRELGELLEGDAETRTDDEQITVFSNNTGMGLQFAAVCGRVYELAEEQDLGHVVDTDLFLEDTTP